MAAGVVRQRITGMRIFVIRAYLGYRLPANRVWPWKPGETFRYLTGFSTTQSEMKLDPPRYAKNVGQIPTLTRPASNARLQNS